MSSKKLYRSTRQNVIAGVCGGLAEYFNIDVTIIRLAWVLSFFLGGAGLLLYIIAAIIIPKGEDIGGTIVIDENGNETFISDGGSQDIKNNSLLFIGAVMIALGIFSLLNRFLPFRFLWNQVKEFGWPLLLILAGVLLLVTSIRRKS